MHSDTDLHRDARTCTRTLELDDATITYDVAEVPSSTHPMLFMIGQPMTAEGFEALASEFAERTVVRPDPRGLGRSTRRDGSTRNDPLIQARDLHALIQHLSPDAPIDLFASSGGAVTALALVSEFPDDVNVLVAHEPPTFAALPDADLAHAASARVDAAYLEHGFNAGMATFIQLVMHQGEFTDEFLAQPLPDPAQFGMPADDDGTRGDPLMSGASRAITDYVPDTARLRAAPTRVVIGVGETSADIVTARAARAIAAQLETEPVTFRGGHGGFAADEWGTPGDPATFADQLRVALATSG